MFGRDSRRRSRSNSASGDTLDTSFGVCGAEEGLRIDRVVEPLPNGDVVHEVVDRLSASRTKSAKGRPMKESNTCALPLLVQRTLTTSTACRQEPLLS